MSHISGYDRPLNHASIWHNERKSVFQQFKFNSICSKRRMEITAVESRYRLCYLESRAISNWKSIPLKTSSTFMAILRHHRYVELPLTRTIFSCLWEFGILLYLYSWYVCILNVCRFKT